MYRNYTSYLWGLPMKLRDPGTRLDSRVRRTTFQDEDVLALTIRYEPDVGTDTWVFYASPKNYRLLGYSLEKADGFAEYVVLEGNYQLENGARIPQIQSWYRTESDEFLGRARLVSAETLR